MSSISVISSGNGYAYVDYPTVYGGETVTLTCVPDAGATLDDVTATESHGYAVALATTEVQSFTYNSEWGDLTINVVFSGGIPPEPPTPGWMWAILFKKKRRY